MVGERWSLLILREVMLGNRRFDGILDRTGAPRAVLTQRLSTLVEQGILLPSAYREPGQRTRTEYRPTTAGTQLQPALTALMDWGDRYLAGPEGPPASVVHTGCGAPVHTHLRCAGGHDVIARDLTASPRTSGELCPPSGKYSPDVGEGGGIPAV